MNKPPRSKKADAVIDRFYVASIDGSPLTAVRELVATLPKALANIGQAFDHNLSAIASTMGIPVTLAGAAAHGRLWTQVLAAERIRALDDEDEGSSESEARTLQRAKEHIERHLASKDGVQRIGHDACDFLLAAYEDPNLARATMELHGQGIVLLWSAFEVLARDLFVFCLNSKPELAVKILESETAKRLFQFKGLDVNVLAQYHFDVSRSMGNILIQFQDLGNLVPIKNVFLALFPDDLTLRRVLSDRDLWLLNQRRHLIVHHRGVVDSKYLESSQETLPIGSQLVIATMDLERSLDIVCSTGSALIKAAAAQFSG